jgi:hypothetical protein
MRFINCFSLPKQIEKGEPPFLEEDLKIGIPDERIRTLLERCWTLEPGRRLSMSEVVAKLRKIGGNVVDQVDCGCSLEASDTLFTPPETPPHEFNELPY